MKELKNLVILLRIKLKLKEENIEVNDLTRTSLIQHRKKDIDAFELSTINASKDPTLRAQIIKNFTKDADDIINRIDLI